MNTDEMEVKLANLREYLASGNFNRSSLIEVLHKTQDVFGYIPTEAMVCIGEVLHIPVSDIFGVVTFYAHFQLYPAGKYNILLCAGTACHVNGALNILEELSDLLGIKDGQTSSDQLFSLHTVACLGCCSLSPVMQINGQTYANLTRGSARKVIKDIWQKEEVSAK